MSVVIACNDGSDNMEDLRYPHLFEPLILGKTYFKNRIFAAPTGFMSQDRFGVLPEEAAFYYGRKAIGGAASVAVGECKVDQEYGCQSVRGVHLDDPFGHAALQRVTEEVRMHGAICTAELSHCGCMANSMNHPPGQAYGPVEGIMNGHHFQEMPEEMILRIIQKFADGARTAKALGFGMVMVHGGHGWLISQFLSRQLNTRKDCWGGSDPENRTRLAIEILKAVRSAVGPGFPIEFRMSGSECYEGGYDIEEGIEIAKRVAPYVDLLHVSAGSHEVQEVFTITHPSMFLPDGCNVKFAEAIKKHVSCKVAAVGALTDPELMEEILASGKADVLEVARGLLADPDLPDKIRKGKPETINTCMRCLNCFSNLISTGHFRCAINPEIGHEKEMRAAPDSRIKRRILIAGGGVAGMQAAITASSLGHDVILCEKTDRLGGTLNCEEQVLFKQKLAQYLKRQARIVQNLNVEVRLNTCVTPEYLQGQQADILIAALGARPIKPPIPGIDGPNVISAESAYYRPDLAGQQVVILGAGLVGIELAIYLTQLGKQVTVVELLDSINTGGNYMHGWALESQIKKLRIPIHFLTRAMNIREDGVQCRQETGEIVFPADTVIYATGQRPLWNEASELGRYAAGFHMIGDVVAPRNIMNATGMAFAVVRSIS